MPAKKKCHPQAYCCKPCTKLVTRVETRKGKTNYDARRKALREAGDGKCFRCFYTGWPLRTDDHHDPYYLTWEHRTPRDEADIVVTAAIINDMKSDLTENEFRKLIVDLANRFNGSEKMVAKIKFTHHRR